MKSNEVADQYVDPGGDVDDEGARYGLLDLILPIARHWLALATISLAGGLAGLGLTYLQKPTFTAKTTLLPPQPQGQAGALLGSLGGLAGLAGGAALKAPGDQYVAMLMSQRIADNLIGRYNLMHVYESEYRFQARQTLAANSRIELGKKDGLISIEVDDEDPRRAADVANRYVDELKLMTSTLAVTEAQQRRAFFERELKTARASLVSAQTELQASGISEATLRAEPKAAAEAVAGVRAEVSATEIRLRMARRVLADETLEVQQLLAKLAGLRNELARAERRQPADDTNYISKFREFKYQEGLVEAFSRQYELARLDEQQDGAVVQVIDVATVPEWKSKPKRARTAVMASLATGFLLIAFYVTRHFLQHASRDPATASKMAELRRALRIRRG